MMLALGIALLGPANLSAQTAPKPDDAQPCAPISSDFRFCGAPPEFTLTPQDDNAAVTAFYTTPEGLQVAIIVEELGISDGLNVTGLQEAALTILSQASGTPPPNIPILERRNLVVDGVPRPNFVYRDTVGGQTFVYSNTIVLLDDSVAQFITIDPGQMVMTGTHRDLHMRFLANSQVNR